MMAFRFRGENLFGPGVLLVDDPLDLVVDEFSRFFSLGFGEAPFLTCRVVVEQGVDFRLIPK